MHLFLYFSDVPVSNLIGLLCSFADDVTDHILVLFIEVPLLSDRIHDRIHLLVQKLLAGYTSHLGILACRAYFLNALTIECLMVLVYRAYFRISRDLYADTVGICLGISDLVPYFIWSI